MSKNMVTKHKWFWAWQDEKEEQWLREMALQGYHLNSMTIGTYEFTTGEPKDEIYRLDFHYHNETSYEEYLEIFRNEGWELVGTLGGWQYFRKEAREGEINEIYTDSESKIAKYQRVIALLTILLPIFILFSTNLNFFKDDILWFTIPVTLILILFFGTYIFAAVKILQRISQLKNT